MSKYRFGTDSLRDEIIARDNFQCTNCKMSREEHKQKYQCDLNVDHIDGNGRNSKTPNNHPSNLITLCKKCHGSKDGKRADYSKRRSYKGENHPMAKIKDFQIKELKILSKNGTTQKDLATKFNLSQSSICRLLLKEI